MAATRPHRGELGEARDLDPPAFVVRQMHVQDIELVAREEINRPQHHGLRMEIAGDVEHEAAVAEARRIHDADRRQRKSGTRRGRGEQVAQRLQPVEHAGRRDAHDANAPRRPARRRIHDERIRLGRRLTRDSADLESQGDAARPRAGEVGTQVLRRENPLVPQRFSCFDPRKCREAQRARSPCHRHGSWEQRRQLARRDHARRGIEDELVLGGRDSPVKRGRHIVGQRDADIFRRVEDDVRTLGHEAAIEEEVGDVRDPHAGTSSQSRKPSCRHKSVQVGHHVLDDEPSTYASRVRRMERAEVDRPAGSGERSRATVRERERRARGGEIGCDAVSHELPADLQRCLGGAGSRREGEQDWGQCSKESVAHGREATPYRGARISTCSVAAVQRSSAASRSRFSVSSSAPSVWALAAPSGRV